MGFAWGCLQEHDSCGNALRRCFFFAKLTKSFSTLGEVVTRCPPKTHGPEEVVECLAGQFGFAFSGGYGTRSNDSPHLAAGVTGLAPACDAWIKNAQAFAAMEVGISEQLNCTNN